MKKAFITLFVAVVATVCAQAQQISVVSSSGATTIFRTLQEAIEGADPNSVIYLPGGGFAISDEVKITKKLTIIGIGHYVKSGNVDGVTTISGNLFFNEGSSGSAVLGCYITGEIIVGEGGVVNDLFIKYCNFTNVNVKNSLCQRITINQNYIRRRSLFGNSDVYIYNNISDKLFNIGSGTINNNIIMDRDGYYYAFADPGYAFDHVNNSTISNNIILTTRVLRGSNSQGNNNLVVGGTWGDIPLVINANNEDLFIKDQGVTPSSNYHFKDDYKQYESQVGVYADGIDFDKQLAPVPYIVAKRVDEQTDASGKLKVKIRVKAGE